jgi:hypothetical protein
MGLAGGAVSSWIRATEGSEKDRFLRAVLRYSYIPLLFLLGMFYVFYLGYENSNASCYASLVIALVLEGIIIMWAWRTSSR